MAISVRSNSKPKKGRKIFLKIEADGYLDSNRSVNHIIENWMATEQGKFVATHCHDLEIYSEVDHAKFLTVTALVGTLDPKHDTYYSLRWTENTTPIIIV